MRENAVVKTAVLDPTRATTLSIGEYAWELRQSVGGVTLSSADGPTEDLEGAAVQVAAYVNGVPSHVMRLVASPGAGGQQLFGIGDGLGVEELEWLSSEVNAHLRTLAEGRAVS